MKTRFQCIDAASVLLLNKAFEGQAPVFDPVWLFAKRTE